MDILFEKIKKNKDLMKKIEAICSIDFFKTYVELSDVALKFSINGFVFASGTGDGYYAYLNDGTIGYFGQGNKCDRIASDFKELLELELNCAYSWYNYSLEKYVKSPELLLEDMKINETKGRFEFAEAYGKEFSNYDSLQKEIAKTLNLSITKNIHKDVLPKLYQIIMSTPKFYWVNSLGDKSDEILH